jgi:hypothetical protein
MYDPDAHLPRINKGMIYLGRLPHCRNQACSREAGQHACSADTDRRRRIDRDGA